MNKITTLAAAALAASLAAAPALAKDAARHSDGKAVKAQKMKKADRQARGQMIQQRDANMNYERGFDQGYNRGYDRRAEFDRSYQRSTTTTYYDRGYDTSYNRTYDDGFWPADVAARAVTSAANTAGAIATAPFRDSYAYYDNTYNPAPVYRTTVTNGWNDNYGWNDDWNNDWSRQTYAQRNGFVCTPGTWYTNSYGSSQLCQ